MNKKNERIKKIAIIGIFSTLSIVLYYLRFSLPFFPEFLKIQFSALPLVIVGYTQGPISGIIALILKTLVCLPLTKTSGVGDLADFIICTAYILTTSLIYKFKKNKKNAGISLIIGVLVWVFVSAAVNYFILIPLYIELLFEGNVESFVNMCFVIPDINNENYKLYYTLYAAIPFNLIISFVVSVITYIVYKRISDILSRY